MKTRWMDILATVVAVAVITGLALALRPQHIDSAPLAPPVAALARPAVAANPADDAGPAPSASRERPSVLFIGDSYTGGRGVPEMSPSCLAAVRMGWQCQLSAVPGTGYISGGPANRFTVNEYIGRSTSFAERIPGLAAKYLPDIVVLDGGRNDHFPPTEDVYLAMAATIADVRRTWPSATVLFIRPRLLADPADDLGFDDQFMARLAAEPTSRGVVVLDPIRRLGRDDTADLLSEDGVHPNRRGERALTQALAESLAQHRTAGPA
ncbi:SGNH/GDSL hydrolase family protein [Mycolicibacterium confluentis]|uniref:Uncharacterized protein n=1 Tax=Mycolicibacterium confluentis TaxID=28047 RepID=A0A7I7XZW1_9MYCO|nr:SGNH/GDSL hydrolase family protein [Mycolicibacterium confluentis]MCV7319839.1 SGNH/GDSL hydrolase family protein [Mycolicibacterium confluentis]ORV34414.1 hypothetical protein AWB99_01985 [Mycolicibacterium confluentis]BBZ34869.1 hypothetical protein MCNF_34740 [Mycolicibacterium confluentis]